MESNVEERAFPDPLKSVDLDSCDRDPIHLPSAIQPHGLLLVARCSDLRIAYASANTKEVLGLEPEAVLGSPLAQIVGEPMAASMVASHGPEVGISSRRLSLRLPGIRQTVLKANCYRYNDLLFLELEPVKEGADWDHMAERMEHAIEGLRQAKTIPKLCDAAAREIRGLTGYDHVMVYRFHSDNHGEVIAEDLASELRPLLNLHFPASDIPAEARALYLLERTRLVADVGYTPAPVLGDAVLGREPLDMTYSGLRSVSPMHIRYLKNIGVGASFAISLIDGDKLWGMVICHHRNARPMSQEMRALCDLLGQILSMLIPVLENKDNAADRLASRESLYRLRELMRPGCLPALVLAEHPRELLDPVGASGALVYMQGYARLVGETPSLGEAQAVMEAMRQRLTDGLIAEEAVGVIQPEFAHLSAVASGAMMISLAGSSEDGVLWFRPEVVQTLNWGGNPLEAKSRDIATGRICPRESSAVWRQQRHGHCEPWTTGVIQMARDFQEALTATLLHQADLKAQLSHVDVLTGLPNRRVLLERLAHRAGRKPESPACLIFIDIDRFRMVNDTLGHGAGDDLLIQVGHRLLECAGARHLVARLGGDEFVVYCEDRTMEEGKTLSQSIMHSFERPFELGGKPFRCVTSIGLALAGSGQTSIADMLHAADSAMSAAKQRGGNQFVVFENQVHAELLRQIQLEQDLFQAIERNEMQVYFQAQVSVDGHRLIGFEALLRWNHPVYANISPAEFIPMAEYTGFIKTLGAWVLRTSLRQIGLWREQFIAELFVAVNVSVKQIAGNDFAQIVQLALEETGIPSEALHLEVTESILMQSSAERQLGAIQDLGVKIAIDDFGTGYSSLSYLPRLAVSEVKLDRSFLENVGTDERKTALFSAIVSMAHSLNLVVVAEGIEETSQLACIRECFCDGAQGYLLSRPMSADKIEGMLLGEWKEGLLLAG